MGFNLKKALICIIGVLAILFVPLIPCLIISEYDTGKALFVLDSAADFAIGYTHSVNKSRVYDFYECRQGITLVKTRFTAYGAGITEPEPDQVFVSGDGYFEIQNINRRLDRLLLATGTIANHEIISSEIAGNESTLEGSLGDSLFFNSIVPPQTRLLFEIRRKSLFFYMTYTALGIKLKL